MFPCCRVAFPKPQRSLSALEENLLRILRALVGRSWAASLPSTFQLPELGLLGLTV